MSGAAFLDRMAAASRARAGAARARVPEATLAAAARTAPRPPALALEAFDVIAEVKRRSPAAGTLEATGFELEHQLAAYAHGGACAVSVLTEPEEFRGSLEHLREAAAHLAALGCPVMRKDFLIEPYQVLEARAAGASGVLVIVTMLSDPQLGELVDCARDEGLFVLLEAFDESDLGRIAAIPLDGFTQPVLAGVNCRNLRNLEVDFGRFAELAPALPAGLPVVAESGIGSIDDIERIVELGYRAALVGSALMQSGDPARTLAHLVAAGRAAASRCS